MSTYNAEDRDLSVEMIMTTLPLETGNAQENVVDIANRMKEHGRGSVIVTEYATTSDGHKTTIMPAGIITERDIVRKIVAESKVPKLLRHMK